MSRHERNAAKRRVAVPITVALVLAALMLLPNAATAGPAAVTNVESGESFSSLTEALADPETNDGDTLTINEPLLTTEQVTIERPIVIDGQGQTLTAGFVRTDNSNNSAIGIQADGVTIENLEVTTATAPTENMLHGFNVFESTGVVLRTVEARQFRSGVVVNSSEVTIDGITTSANIWHAINVDQVTSEPASLTIGGTNAHGENSPDPVSDFVDGENVAHLFVDDAADDVTIDDVDGQYQIREVAFRGGVARAGTLAAPLADPTTFVEIISGDVGAENEADSWLFNRDTNTSSPFDFVVDDEAIGSGSLFVAPIAAEPAADKFIAEYYPVSPVGTFDRFSVDVKLADGVAPADAQGLVYLNVYMNYGESVPTKFFDCRYNVIADALSSADYGTVTFDPTVPYPVATSASSPSDDACPAQPLGMGGDATVRMIAVNLGDTSAEDAGLSGFVDNARVVTDTSDVVYDLDPEQFFADVGPTAPFYGDIQWMGYTGISTGVENPEPEGKPLYLPLDSVKRQAMAAFLYRLAGEPVLESEEQFFADVDSDHPFYDAIQWMGQAGISTGIVNPAGGDPLYLPQDVVRRQAMAAFLYRLEGEPELESDEQFFADVEAGDPFYDAIQWMGQTGVSTGTPVEDGKPIFDPLPDVKRQAMAAFLHRLDDPVPVML